MRHVLVSNPNRTAEYGVLQDFEDEICELTGATRVSLPRPEGPAAVTRRAAHGTRWSFLRHALPKRPFPGEGDVLWVVLMAPYDLELDRFTEWQRSFKYKIVYLFDTLEGQLADTARLFPAADWTLRLTSFAEAVPDLEARTGGRWHVVPQGVRANRFRPAPLDQRTIDVSAYGRRHPRAHAATQAATLAAGRYYDFSAIPPFKQPIVPADAYAQYAWHLTHSKLTTSWPVAVTSPSRARRYDPITCRWFEAAASATPILGRLPNPELFRATLGFDDVVEIADPNDEDAVKRALERAWRDASSLHERALANRARLLDRWTWASRVHAILRLLEGAG